MPSLGRDHQRGASAVGSVGSVHVQNAWSREGPVHIPHTPRTARLEERQVWGVQGGATACLQPAQDVAAVGEGAAALRIGLRHPTPGPNRAQVCRPWLQPALTHSAVPGAGPAGLALAALWTDGAAAAAVVRVRRQRQVLLDFGDAFEWLAKIAPKTARALLLVPAHALVVFRRAQAAVAVLHVARGAAAVHVVALVSVEVGLPVSAVWVRAAFRGRLDEDPSLSVIVVAVVGSNGCLVRHRCGPFSNPFAQPAGQFECLVGHIQRLHIFGRDEAHLFSFTTTRKVERARYPAQPLHAILVPQSRRHILPHAEEVEHAPTRKNVGLGVTIKGIQANAACHSLRSSLPAPRHFLYLLRSIFVFVNFFET